MSFHKYAALHTETLNIKLDVNAAKTQATVSETAPNRINIIGPNGHTHMLKG